MSWIIHLRLPLKKEKNKYIWDLLEFRLDLTQSYKIGFYGVEICPKIDVEVWGKSGMCFGVCGTIFVLEFGGCRWK